MSTNKNILAVDPSLTCSGWALFSVEKDLPLAAGTLSPPGPGKSLPSRMTDLQEKISALFLTLQLRSGDILVCEGPAPLVKNPQSALKVEGVRGLFETLARSIGMVVPGRVNPRTVQSELLGMRGKQLPREQVKAWARGVALQMYGQPLLEILGVAHENAISQDIIDALLIGSFLQSRIRISLQTGISVETAIQPQSSGRGYGGSRRGSGWTLQQGSSLLRRG